MRSTSRKISFTLLVLLLMGGSFFAGSFFGTTRVSYIEQVTDVANKEEGKPMEADFSLFWKAWVVLNDKFVPAKNKEASVITAEDKVYGAIQGLADSYGDPYTTFFPPEEAKIFQDEISGNFEGVGMELGIKNNILTIVAPLKGTPAERAGVKSGDKIIEIDDESTQGLSIDGAIKKIRGKKGTSVKLTLIREGTSDPLIVTIIRDVIDIPIIDTEVKRGVFVIHLHSFSENSPVLFRNALEEFIRSKTSRLVIDLRGNPGGYLDAAVDMASWFLPSGKTVFSEDFGDKRESVVYRSRGYNIFNENLRLAILIDGGSASASEILAGALSQHDLGTLVGTATFGKGSVQELVPLTSKTSLKVTVARWLTPDGTSLSETGLTPDIEVKVDPAALDSTDIQLEKAIDVVLK